MLRGYKERHAVWKSPKMSHLKCWILASSINIDLSGNTVWHFGIFNEIEKVLNETFSVIFKHRVVSAALNILQLLVILEVLKPRWAVWQRSPGWSPIVKVKSIEARAPVPFKCGPMTRKKAVVFPLLMEAAAEISTDFFHEISVSKLVKKLL